MKTKLMMAAGIVFAIVSFSEKKEETKKGEKKSPKILHGYSSKCFNCGTEVFSEDNYCPECGKKILP